MGGLIVSRSFDGTVIPYTFSSNFAFFGTTLNSINGALYPFYFF